MRKLALGFIYFAELVFFSGLASLVNPKFTRGISKEMLANGPSNNFLFPNLFCFLC